MAKIKNRFLGLIIWGLFFVLYNAIVLLLTDFESVKGTFWSAFAFNEVAFIAVGGMMCFTKLKKNDAFSTFIPHYVVSAVYFGITFLVNLIFLLVPSSDNITFNVILNLIFIIAYAAALIVVFKGSSHIQENEERIIKKSNEFAILEIKVGALAARTNDAAVKVKIAELKDKIHYSDAFGVEETAEAEREIKDKIDLVGSLLSAEAAPEDVVKALEQAIESVKIRNQILLASK